MKLKTLKDIREQYGGSNINDTEPIIKNFGLDFDDENAGDVAHLLNHLWEDLINEARAHLTNNLNEETINWIKHFFNLNER